MVPGFDEVRLEFDGPVKISECARHVFQVQLDGSALIERFGGIGFEFQGPV